jgi:hypothetical protein
VLSGEEWVQGADARVLRVVLGRLEALDGVLDLLTQQHGQLEGALVREFLAVSDTPIGQLLGLMRLHPHGGDDQGSKVVPLAGLI